MYYKWKPSKKAKLDFAKTMDAIRSFCDDHCISHSNSMDSYYFSVNNKNYRVSNHSVESSFINSNGLYHQDGRSDDIVYIHASKTRLIEIYNDLAAGYSLNGNGYRI